MNVPSRPRARLYSGGAPNRSRLRIVSLVLAACWACAEADAPSSRGWTLNEDLRIGSVASDGPDQFGYVAALGVDGMDRIWVIDGPSHQVRIFDADGGLVRVFGHEGQGPGEFLTPNSLELGPDGNVWISDGQNGRFSVFDTAGAYVTSHAFAPGMYRFGDRWGPDGLLYTHVMRDRNHMTIVRRRLVEGALEPVDTLSAPDVDPGEVVTVGFVRDGRRMSLMVPVPLQATAMRALVPGVGWWLSPPGEQYRVARLDFAGDTTLVLERSYEPVPVTEADIDAALARIGRGIEMERSAIPTHHPPVSGLTPLPDGRLLVRRTVLDGEAFDLFDASGAFVDSMRLPDGVRPFTFLYATNDALYGVARDELDVPYVVRLRIEQG